MSYADINMTQDINTEDRMRSISTNAVQEARVAKGRGALPFLDKDSRIQHMIERLLHELTDVSSVSLKDEHYPLVEKTQPVIGKVLDQMNDILDNLSNEITTKSDEPIVKASLPKAK